MWEPKFFHLHPYSAHFCVQADSFTWVYLTFQTYQSQKLTAGVASNKDNAHNNIEQENGTPGRNKSLSTNGIYQGVSWTLKKKKVFAIFVKCLHRLLVKTVGFKYSGKLYLVDLMVDLIGWLLAVFWFFWVSPTILMIVCQLESFYLQIGEVLGHCQVLIF